MRVYSGSTHKATEYYADYRAGEQESNLRATQFEKVGGGIKMQRLHHTLIHAEENAGVNDGPECWYLERGDDVSDGGANHRRTITAGRLFEALDFTVSARCPFQ